MNRFRTVLPCLIAGLLLSMSIAIPIVLSNVQDEALLSGVKTEAISQDTQNNRKKTGISISERLDLVRGGNVSRVSTYRTDKDPNNLSLKDEPVNQILQEAEKLQERGGFPVFDLRKGFQKNSNMSKVTFISYEGWKVSIFILTVFVSDAVYDILADADTYTIYQYEVGLEKAAQMPMDKKTVSAVFSDYLSISREQFKTLYSFSTDDRITLALR